MIGQAIEMLSNELTEITASSRHQSEIYVFPGGLEVAKNFKNHIAKFVFRTFFCFCFLIFFEFAFSSDSI